MEERGFDENDKGEKPANTKQTHTRPEEGEGRKNKRDATLLGLGTRSTFVWMKEKEGRTSERGHPRRG